MSPEEHAFYMTKLAQLEARAIILEQRLAALFGNEESAGEAADAPKSDAAEAAAPVRKLNVLT